MDGLPWQGRPAVVFRYAEDRRGRHVKEHLEGFPRRAASRLLLWDGELAEADRPSGAITLAFCPAHVRRQFFDVHKQTTV